MTSEELTKKIDLLASQQNQLDISNSLAPVLKELALFFTNPISVFQRIDSREIENSLTPIAIISFDKSGVSITGISFFIKTELPQEDKVLIDARFVEDNPGYEPYAYYVNYDIEYGEIAYASGYIFAKKDDTYMAFNIDY